MVSKSNKRVSSSAKSNVGGGPMQLREGYEVFVRNLDELVEGKEMEAQIRDCETCTTRVVRALFSRSKEKLPDGEPVWVRALVGHLLDEEPWRIKIIKVVKES